MTDAAKVLLENDWTWEEIKSVLDSEEYLYPVWPIAPRPITPIWKYKPPSYYWTTSDSTIT
jgi:hypothetical protein